MLLPRPGPVGSEAGRRERGRQERGRRERGRQERGRRERGRRMSRRHPPRPTSRSRAASSPAAGAAALLEAVPRARDQQDRWALENLAAKWIERGYRSAEAARLVDGMAKSSPAGAFRRYLEMRAKRLRDLDQLKYLAAEYQSRFGRKLEQINDLVATGMINQIPVDPLGAGYTLDAAGEPTFGGTVPAGRNSVSDEGK